MRIREYPVWMCKRVDVRWINCRKLLINVEMHACESTVWRTVSCNTAVFLISVFCTALGLGGSWSDQTTESIAVSCWFRSSSITIKWASAPTVQCIYSGVFSFFRPPDIYTLCLKNDTDVAHYNFDTDQPILIIFGRDVAERVCYQTVICYPNSPK